MFEIKKIQDACLQYRVENKPATGAMMPMGDFACLCGVSYATLYELLNKGQNPSLRTLDRICRTIGRKIEEFYS